MGSKDRLEILWEDEKAMAVTKPADLATIPGRGETDSLVERLSRQIGLKLRLVHRLDKETSGVILFAKDLEGQRALSRQFQNNLISKEYLAIVAGRPAEMEGIIDAPLGAHPTDPKRRAVVKTGRAAKTEWKVEQLFRELALLRCFPRTGKTHQIRVHLAHIGLPLAVDAIYNRRAGPIMLSKFKRDYKPSEEGERPLIARLTLHAHRLTFRDWKEQTVTVECPMPKDFRSAVNMLGKYSHA